MRLLAPTSMSKTLHESLLTGLRPVEIMESVKPINKEAYPNTIMIASMFGALQVS